MIAETLRVSISPLHPRSPQQQTATLGVRSGDPNCRHLSPTLEEVKGAGHPHPISQY
jgi:hypothetical protein